ncbi:hypothetical protein GCM10023093_05820 [Nemorincola caseinilytica]|uniref:Bacterial surface antigen (D15) domain-containing protein n=1 Tax=Nemorincola caseinilytica TaxID=2054315 RepID=A0ABP8N4S8_9BACT
MLCRGEARGQFCPYTPYRLSVHVTNPLGLLSKAGLRLQYRLSSANSVLLGYRHYYGFFPGYQAFGEFHRYFSIQNAENEAFFYGKMGVGNAGYAPKPYFAGAEDPYGVVDGYLFAGGGVGKRINIGHFFIEGNIGVKLASPIEKKDDYNKNLFYSLGPGSFLDCGIHLGLQFFDEERNMYNHSLRAHKPYINR